MDDVFGVLAEIIHGLPGRFVCGACLPPDLRQATNRPLTIALAAGRDGRRLVETLAIRGETMTRSRQPLIAGNWKMNGLEADALALAKASPTACARRHGRIARC